jgi:hypothetical protein
MKNPGLGVNTLFTPLQQQRYDFLFPMYGPLSGDIVTNLHGKGKYSWTTFLEKMNAVEQAKAHVKEYYKALYEAFALYKVFTSGQIIGIVNEVRRDMRLIQYTEKIKLQSEHDFNLVFVVVDQYKEVEIESGMAKEFVGYKPVAQVLMPE